MVVRGGEVTRAALSPVARGVPRRRSIWRLSSRRRRRPAGRETVREDVRERTRRGDASPRWRESPRGAGGAEGAEGARVRRCRQGGDGSVAGRSGHRLRHVRSYQPAPGEREGVNVTSNITTVDRLARPILAGLPVATRVMNAVKSSRGRSRVRTSGQKPHRIHEDAAQAHRLSPGPRAARRGRRVTNNRRERSYETDSAVPPPRWNSRRRVARRASPRRIDVVAMSGHPTRSSRAQIRRAVEVCRPRRPPRASSRRTKTRRATSAITCAFSRSTLRRARLQSILRDGAEERGEARVPSRDAFDGIRQRQIPRIRRG